MKRCDLPKRELIEPLGDAEVKEKFISLAADVISEKKAIRIIDMVWRLEDLKDIRELVFFLRE